MVYLGVIGLDPADQRAACSRGMEATEGTSDSLVLFYSIDVGNTYSELRGAKSHTGEL